jgi:hypothetical protein
MGLPSNVICPSSGSESPATMSRNVDLPQPLGPSITKNSPLFISRSTPFKATNLQFCCLFLSFLTSKVFLTCIASILDIVPVHLFDDDLT